jgi:hypothetical protein
LSCLCLVLSLSCSLFFAGAGTRTLTSSTARTTAHRPRARTWTIRSAINPAGSLGKKTHTENGNWPVLCCILFEKKRDHYVKTGSGQTNKRESWKKRKETGVFSLSAAGTIPCVRENGIFELNAIFYQDRLETNIGKTQKQSGVFSGGHKALIWEGGTRVPGFVHSPLLPAAVPAHLLSSFDRSITCFSFLSLRFCFLADCF